jgi:beta-glucosidase
MVKAAFNFPRGFLWGAATSSHQVEGNNKNNNWWEWEQENGRILNNDKSGSACDWWGGRWKEDFDRADESHHNAHRLSIEWSRVQPSPDRWDETALERYREIIRSLVERKMVPIVTLHHFSNPIWIEESGGWEKQDIPDLFVKYSLKVVDALKEYVNMWVTINEPNVVMANGYLLGLFPPGKSAISASMRVMTNMVRAHADAYHAIHNLQPNARVGTAVQFRGLVPHRNWFPGDIFAAKISNSLFNNFFPVAFSQGILNFAIWKKRISNASNTLDFLGINYYTREYISFNLLNLKELFTKRTFSPQDDLSDSGSIANAPDYLFEALKWGLKFNRPMIITENGVENRNDILRCKYIIQHIHQVWRAVNFNFPVKGYLYWTLVDNFEWERGWTQRFGLWELDPDTQTRSKRPSADLFSEICKGNCLTSDLVAEYSPELLAHLFPG